MKKLLTILSTVFLVASCAISDFEKPSSPTTGSGTEAVDSLGFFELTLSSVPATRATTTQITPEEAANFLITIYKGSDIVRQTVRLGDLDTRLSAGYGYTVTAESCSETEAESANDGWGQKRFAGLSASFAIVAGKTTAVDVGCSVANAGIELTYDESLLDYFTSVEVTVKSGNRTLTFTKSGQIAYFNTNVDGLRTATYTITAVGPNSTLTKEGTLDLGKAKMSHINLQYEIGTFELSVLVEEADLTDDEVVIHEEDIQTDDGKTEVNATFTGYSETARTDINTYGQASVSLSATSPIDWAQAESNVAVYDYTTEKREFPVSSAEGVQRLDGNVTPKTRDFLAAYPYSQAGDALSEGKIVFTLPDEQRALAVAPGTELASSKMNYAVAKGQRSYDGSLLNLTFQPVCQVLQFQVPEYAAGRISAIQFTADTPVAGKLAVDVSGEKPTTAIASTESPSITILPPARESTFPAGTYYILTAPVQMNGFSMSFQCEGTGYTLSGTSTLGGEAGKLYPLGYIDLVNIPEVTPAHQYSNNVLQGTKLTLTNAPIPGKQWNVTVKKGTTAVRNISGSNNLSSPETDASWPYLPKGNYTAEYSFRNSNDTQSSDYSVDFSVGSPTITLVVDGYSAHTKYEAGDVDGANACERKTIYNPSARLSVAAAIFDNSNYNGLGTYSHTFNNGEAQTETATSNNPVWTNYTNVAVSANLYRLSVSATFDGANANAYKDFRITGLPVKYEPPTKSEWVEHGSPITWHDNNVQLGRDALSSNQNITCSDFNIPLGVKLALDYNIIIHAGFIGTRFTATAGDDVLYDNASHDNRETFRNDDFPYTGTGTTVTSSIVTTMKCNNSYGAGATRTHIYSLFYKYGK